MKLIKNAINVPLFMLLTLANLNTNLYAQEVALNGYNLEDIQADIQPGLTREDRAHFEKFNQEFHKAIVDFANQSCQVGIRAANRKYLTALVAIKCRIQKIQRIRALKR